MVSVEGKAKLIFETIWGGREAFMQNPEGEFSWSGYSGEMDDKVMILVSGDASFPPASKRLDKTLSSIYSALKFAGPKKPIQELGFNGLTPKSCRDCGGEKKVEYYSNSDIKYINECKLCFGIGETLDRTAGYSIYGYNFSSVYLHKIMKLEPTSFIYLKDGYLIFYFNGGEAILKAGRL
ncbi:MAG TPA: hypothetical protein DCS78_03630 [Pseudoalteromonas shioyasakiensis]|nr:hypothetical protein [Pseudoalteromonas shioyasakiensis]|tara:strand:+ start:106 stop:645 length:540 start_codon:yes stop_codon:yes gene_type:complete